LKLVCSRVFGLAKTWISCLKSEPTKGANTILSEGPGVRLIVPLIFQLLC
jgi:hypothetical protein